MYVELKILHLEDTAEDAILVKSIFEKENIQCDIDLVEDKESFENALFNKTYDLILSDYSVPAYGGTDALIFRNKNFPQIPFIYVSGTIGEDIAIESLLKGATDYVLKSKLSRLIPAVIRALSEANLKKDRLKAEEELRKSRELLEKTFESLSDAVLIIDKKNRTIVNCNPAVEKILGYKPEELIGKTTEMLHIDREHYINFGKISDAVLAKNLRFETEFKLKRKDGRHIHTENTVTVAIDENGEWLNAVSVIKDITGRKKAFDEIRKLSLAVEQSPASVIITDKDGKIEYVNPRFSEITGYNLSEVIGKNPRFLQSGLTKKKIYADMWNTILSGNKWMGEMQNKKKSGEFYWEFNYISPIKDEKGNITHFLALQEDITEQKKSLKRLRQNEEQLKIIANETGVVFYRLRYNTMKYEYVHSNIEVITGYTVEEINKIGFDSIVIEIESQFDNQMNLDKLKIARMNKSVTEVRADYLIRKKDEQTVWLSDCSYPWFDDEQKLIGSIGILVDVTERKNFILQLIEAKENAETMNRLKSNFLANMSHELRTPLIGILGFSEILSTELTDPSNIKMVSLISESGNRLMETLNLILDLSRIESDKLQINFTKINLVSIAEEVIKLYKKSADGKKLYLNLTTKEKEIWQMADERMLILVLGNLINNAVKYTDSGGVVVEINSNYINNKLWNIIKVIDTGIGIDEKYHEIIFEEFRQASEGLSRIYEGTGLGLTITKKFIEKMKGKISVQSKVNMGTTFTVMFPDDYNEN